MVSIRVEQPPAPGTVETRASSRRWRPVTTGTNRWRRSCARSRRAVRRDGRDRRHRRSRDPSGTPTSLRATPTPTGISWPPSSATRAVPDDAVVPALLEALTAEARRRDARVVLWVNGVDDDTDALGDGRRLRGAERAAADARPAAARRATEVARRGRGPHVRTRPRRRRRGSRSTTGRSPNHPDQGGWVRRRSQAGWPSPGSTPARFLLAFDADGLAGFCWTEGPRANRATTRARRDLRDRRRPRPPGHAASGARSPSAGSHRARRARRARRGCSTSTADNAGALAPLPRARLHRAPHRPSVRREPHAATGAEPPVRRRPATSSSVLLAELGEPAYRADQVLRRAVDATRARSRSSPAPEGAARPARRGVAARARAGRPVHQRRRRRRSSGSGSARDGAQVETVLMRYPDRATVCVSSQAGCAMGCTFCATGQAGFERHLDAARSSSRSSARRGTRAAARCATSCSWAWASRSRTSTRCGPRSSGCTTTSASRPATSRSRRSASCPASARWPPSDAAGHARGLAARPRRRAARQLVPLNRRYPHRRGPRRGPRATPRPGAAGSRSSTRASPA